MCFGVSWHCCAYMWVPLSFIIDYRCKTKVTCCSTTSLLVYIFAQSRHDYIRTLAVSWTSQWCICMPFQVAMMLPAGYFRVRNALPGPMWVYPMSYIAFHTYSIQVNLCVCIFYSQLLEKVILSRLDFYVCFWFFVGIQLPKLGGSTRIIDLNDPILFP